MTIAADAAKPNAAEQAAAAAAAKAATDAAAAAADAAKGTQTPEQKAAADKAATDAAAAAAAGGEKNADGTPKKPGESKDGDDKKPKAPAAYKLVVPDDVKLYLPERDLTFLQEVARKNDMTNDEAQALLNEQAALVLERANEYLTETKADKTYGGANLEQTTRSVHRLINAVRPEGHPRRESFLRFMNQGGAGNHIDVLSFMADVAKKIGEDDPTHAGGQGKGERPPLHDRLYGGKPASKE